MAMKKAHWLALFLALGLLLGILGRWLAQPVTAGPSPGPVHSPILGPFINIRVDSLENYSPAVAYNSLHDEYLVVWYTEQDQYTWDIWGGRVGSDGTLKSSFCVATGAGQKRWQPAVAYSPAQDEYLIVYTYEVTSDDYDLLAKRVKWDGSWVSPEFVINYDADKQWDPAVAYNSQDDEYLVVYENRWAGGLKDIAAQRVKATDASLSLLSWANVATGVGEDRYGPDVAYNPAGNDYLIAYGMAGIAVPTPPNIRGKVAPASLAGVSVSPEIHICCEDAHQQWGVSVAAGPEDYLVVYIEGIIMGNVRGRRVSGAGTPLGPGRGFPIMADFSFMADVAYGARYGYLVAWGLSSFGGPSGDDVYGRYVMPGHDSAVGNEFPIDDGPDSQRLPAVACAPSGDCLVVEEDNWPGADFEIRGRFVMPWHVYLPMVLRNY